MSKANEIYKNVLNAMQEAEEIEYYRSGEWKADKADEDPL